MFQIPALVPLSKPSLAAWCVNLGCSSLDPPPQPAPPPDSWAEWLQSLFPAAFADRQGRPTPFAEFHVAFWEWVWRITPGVRPQPFVAVWARNTGKSTNAEIACIAVGALGVRRYCWYVSATQEQADTHVQNIAAWLESERVAARYPALSQRKLSKFGHPRAWRRNRIWTHAGVIVDAIGLDTAVRGVKLEAQRPDFIVIDDVDLETDSPTATERKIAALTQKILPAGAQDCAILFVQNLVHEHSIASRLVDGRADFLAQRIVSGPFPALRHLTYTMTTDPASGRRRMVITGGEPTWAAFGLPECQALVDDIGARAFLAECQHEKSALYGSLFGEVFLESVHTCEPFPIPAQWYVDCAHDWGSSAPFATLWFAEATGETFQDAAGVQRWVPRGTLFVIAEDYGWNGRPNEGLRLTNVAIAQRIRAVAARLASSLLAPGARIHPGPADPQINTVINGASIAADYLSVGVRFEAAEKGPGSRVTGWKNIYDRLVASSRTPMEAPGLFFFRTCPQVIRTLPLLMRSLTDPDDSAPEAEDHLLDCLRYRCLWRRRTFRTAEVYGV